MTKKKGPVAINRSNKPAELEIKNEFNNTKPLNEVLPQDLDTKEKRQRFLEQLGIVSETGFYYITPTMAEQLLKLNNNIYANDGSNNRKRNNQIEKDYVAAMVKGQRHRSNDFIAFDDTFSMVNGQHRCYAVWKSGMTVEIGICFGVKAFPDMDNGNKRKAIDNINIFESGDSDTRDNKIAGAISAMLRLKLHGSSRPTIEEIRQVFIDLQEYLVPLTPTLMLDYLPQYFRVAIIAAYMNGVSLDDIANFSAAYNEKKMFTEKDRIAVNLRMHHRGADNTGECRTGGSASSAKPIFCSTQWALNEYILGNSPVPIPSCREILWDYSMAYLNIDHNGNEILKGRRYS